MYISDFTITTCFLCSNIGLVCSCESTHGLNYVCPLYQPDWFLLRGGPLLIYVCPVASKLDLLCVFEKYCFRLCFLKGSFKNFRFLFRKSFILHTYYPNIMVSRNNKRCTTQREFII